jgi:hypothetical protein
MMSGTFRGTLFFVGGLSGWTESYYLTGADLNWATTDLNEIILARMPLLHSSCGLVNATVSDTSIKGDSLSTISVYEPGTGVDATGYLDFDLALCVKWRAGNFQRCKTFLRGCPNGEFQFGKFKPTPAFTTLLDAYITVIMGSAQVRQLKVTHPSPPTKDDYEFVPITAGTPNVDIARRKTGRPSGLPRGRRLAG